VLFPAYYYSTVTLTFDLVNQKCEVYISVPGCTIKPLYMVKFRMAFNSSGRDLSGYIYICTVYLYRKMSQTVTSCVIRGCSRFRAAHFSAGLHCRTKSDAVHACKMIVLAKPKKSPLQRMTSNTCRLHCLRYNVSSPTKLSNSAKEQ